MSKLLDRFFAPQPMQALVVSRIVLGLILFTFYAHALPDVPTVWGPEGLGGHALQQRAGLHLDLGGRPLEAPLRWLTANPSMELTWGLYGLLLASSLAFALGLWTRPAGAVALLLHALFYARNYHAYWGWGSMLRPYMLFVLLAPVGRYASIDAWRRGRELLPAGPWLAPGWTTRLVQMQVCTMYLVAGFGRLHNPAWQRGEALYALLVDRTFGRLDIDWFPVVGLLEWLTYGALLIEPLAPLLLWISGIGKWWVVGLVALHFGLEALGNAGWWQPMLSALLLTFVPWQWSSALLAVGPRRKIFRDISGY